MIPGNHDQADDTAGTDSVSPAPDSASQEASPEPDDWTAGTDGDQAADGPSYDPKDRTSSSENLATDDSSIPAAPQPRVTAQPRVNGVETLPDQLLDRLREPDPLPGTGPRVIREQLQVRCAGNGKETQPRSLAMPHYDIWKYCRSTSRVQA